MSNNNSQSSRELTERTAQYVIASVDASSTPVVVCHTTHAGKPETIALWKCLLDSYTEESPEKRNKRQRRVQGFIIREYNFGHGKFARHKSAST